MDNYLATASLTRQAIDEPLTRISLRQLLLVLSSCCNTIEDPMLALRIGQQLHLTAYGMAGFALLSSATLEEAIEIANDFALLLNLKQRLRVERQDALARITLVDNFSLVGNDKYFCALLETSKVLTLLRDILGHRFEATWISLNITGSDQEAEAISALLQVPVTLNSTQNSICFHSQFLGMSLPQSHSITHNACKTLCTIQLQEVSQRYNLCYQIQKILLASTSCIPALTEIAGQLHLSPRTLRRRLEAMDTSYNQILEELRKKLAIRYLLDTPMTTEAISEKLSYSDAANFRHAFKRWTGASPKAFRSQNRDIDFIPASLHAMTGNSRQPSGIGLTYA
ncbi:AraC family transcriptional regulator ligand-binding domain-containing protein [Pseudomonas farris]